MYCRKSLSKRADRFSDAETKLHSTRDKFIRPRDLTELRGYLCGNVEFALSSALDEDLLKQQYFPQRESIQTPGILRESLPPHVILRS